MAHSVSLRAQTQAKAPLQGAIRGREKMRHTDPGRAAVGSAILLLRCVSSPAPSLAVFEELCTVSVRRRRLYAALARQPLASPKLELKPFERLQAYWLETNANVQTTTLTEATVAEPEHKYDVRIPGDFREYLLQSCPSNENWDQGACILVAVGSHQEYPRGICA
jgi:hypothetical protein